MFGGGHFRFRFLDQVSGGAAAAASPLAAMVSGRWASEGCRPWGGAKAREGGRGRRQGGGGQGERWRPAWKKDAGLESGSVAWQDGSGGGEEARRPNPFGGIGTRIAGSCRGSEAAKPGKDARLCGFGEALTSEGGAGRQTAARRGEGGISRTRLEDLPTS